MKVKRKQINEIYGDVIEDMYNKESPPAGSRQGPSAQVAALALE